MPKSSVNNISRLTSAIAIAPLAIIPAMLLAISILRIIFPDAQAELLRQYHGGLVISFFGLLIGYVFTILYGLPVYWLLNKLNHYNMFTVSLASLIPAFLFSIFNNEQWPYYLGMAYFSIFVAITFLKITIRKK